MEWKPFEKFSDIDWEEILKPDWKEVFKPDWKKILVFLIFFLLSSIPHAINNDVLCSLVGGAYCSQPLKNTIIGFPFIFYNFETTSFRLLGLAANLIFWYLASCIIVWFLEEAHQKRIG